MIHFQHLQHSYLGRALVPDSLSKCCSCALYLTRSRQPGPMYQSTFQWVFWSLDVTVLQHLDSDKDTGKIKYVVNNNTNKVNLYGAESIPGALQSKWFIEIK